MHWNQSITGQAVMLACLACAAPKNIYAQTEEPVREISVAPADAAPCTLAEQRLLFQSQELMTSKQASWIFLRGSTPRIIWRDVDEIRKLGGDVNFRVRWFNSQLEEFPEPMGNSRRWNLGSWRNGSPIVRVTVTWNSSRQQRLTSFFRTIADVTSDSDARN